MSEANGIGKTLTAEGYTGNVRKIKIFSIMIMVVITEIFVKTINCTLKRVNFILLNYPLKVIVKENN